MSFPTSASRGARVHGADPRALARGSRPGRSSRTGVGDGGPARAPAQRDDAPNASARRRGGLRAGPPTSARRGPRRRPWRTYRLGRSVWASRTPSSPTITSVPARRGDAGLRDRPYRDQRGASSSSKTVGTGGPSCGATRAGRGARPRRRGAAAALEPTTAACALDARIRSTRTFRSCTCRGTGSPTRAGAAPGCPARRNGRTAASWDEAGARSSGGSRGAIGRRTTAWRTLDQLAFGPAPAAPTRAASRATGCWAWPAIAGVDVERLPRLPGFSAWPYPEYSEVFFNRGYGSCAGRASASRPSAARTTFRNWDLPQRRQIFAGFRLAADGP